MESTEETKTLLRGIRKALPALMPGHQKELILEMACLQGAGLAADEGRDSLEAWDLARGIHRFADPRLARSLMRPFQAAGIPLEAARAGLAAHDHLDLDVLLGYFSKAAGLLGTALDIPALQHTLGMFRTCFEDGTVYIKSSTQKGAGGELFFRGGFSSRCLDLRSLCLSGGLPDPAQAPVWPLWQALHRLSGVQGHMVDVSPQGRIQKFYGFCPRRPGALAALARSPLAPPALKKNLEDLQALGFGVFYIFGVDLHKASINLYLPANQGGELDDRRVSTLLGALEIPPGSPGLMQEIRNVFSWYLTLPLEGDVVRRVCFSRQCQNLPQALPAMADGLKPFATQLPMVSRRRPFVLGATLGREDSYLKVEADLKGMLHFPFISPYTGLWKS